MQWTLTVLTRQTREPLHAINMSMLEEQRDFKNQLSVKSIDIYVKYIAVGILDGKKSTSTTVVGLWTQQGNKAGGPGQ